MAEKQKDIKDTTVYHYCSLDTFHKILQSGCIRLSEIDKSNDSREITWLRDYIEYAFREQYRAESAHAAEGLPKEALYNALLGEMLDYYFGEERPYNFLVACFSQKADVLSQWRGYADDARSVCVGLSQQALQALIEDALWMKEMPEKGTDPFGEVRYIEQAGYEAEGATARYTGWIKNAATELLRKLRQIEQGVPQGTYPKGHGKETQRRYEFERVIHNAYCRAPYYKNKGFAEEQEWRLVKRIRKAISAPKRSLYLQLPQMRLKNFRDESLSAMVRGSKLVFYQDVPFPQLPAGQSVLQEVILGPKCQVSQADMYAFLVLHDMHLPHEAIRRSTISYR